MSLWASWFGTPTEEKREQYRALYHDLKNQLSNFNSKLRTMEGKVDNYMGSRPGMSESFIPEDVFSGSERNVKSKIESVRNNQSTDAKKLSRAVDAAYQRYQHYARLAEQERLVREAEQRRQAERRRREMAARNRRNRR